MEEKLKELLSDEEYVKELIELRDPEKISDSLAEHDVDLSPKEIEKTIKILKMKQSGELSDAELESIARGMDPFTAFVIALGLTIAAVGNGTLIAKSCG